MTEQRGPTDARAATAQGVVGDSAHDGPSRPGAGAKTRAEVVERAVESWARSLTDMTGRNQLLYFKAPAKSTLDLDHAVSAAVLRLYGGTPVTVSELYGGAATARSWATAAEPVGPYGDVPPESAEKAARALFRRSQEHFEERGISTLWVARDFATWRSVTSKSTPAAPVLLCPALLKPVSGSATGLTLQLDGDWTVNEAFLQLLSSDFGVKFSAGALDGGIEASEDAEGWRRQVLSRLRAAGAEVPEFEIRERAVVATLLYQKMPMVNDLRGAVSQLTDHDIVAAMAGWEPAQATLRENRSTVESVTVAEPDRISPDDEFLVLDSDSSQNHVINAVLAGASIVVQGPPGTGKSQTIANLVATAVARGKKVLFVAEKRAAIEAVVGRLEQHRLGDLVMDMHGGLGSRRQMAADVKATLDAISATGKAPVAHIHTSLTLNRTKLNGHADALHRVLEPFGVSAFEAQERLLDLSDVRTTGFAFPAHRLDDFDSATIGQAADHLREWVGLTERLRSGESRWADTTATTADEVTAITGLVGRLHSDLVPTCQRRLDQALTATGLHRPASIDGWSALLETLQGAVAVLAMVATTIYDESLEQLSEQLAPGGRSWLSRTMAQMFNGAYRAAKRVVRGHWSVDEKAPGRELLAAVALARDTARAWNELGGRGHPSPPDGVALLVESHGELTSALLQLGAHVASVDMSTLDTGQLRDDLAARNADRLTLAQLPRVHQLEGWLGSFGLAGMLSSIRQGEVRDEIAVEALMAGWYEEVLQRIRLSEPELQSFHGPTLTKCVETFQQADVDHIASTPLRVRRAVAEATIAAGSAHPDQDQLLRKEANKKSRHIPVRELFEGTMDVLVAAKPCWTMSPLSVAQILPPRQLFDLVVFDEASQIPPEDAVSAILRGRQVVVAGDRLQLPPTSFFSQGENDEEHEVGVTTGFESVLDSLDTLLPGRMLTWHYRSADERLIAFSNANIYSGTLTTFPGIGDADVLRFERVSHEPRRGGERKSWTVEIERVVDLLMEHAVHRPHEKIGVIAFGVAHANRIQAALDDRIAGSHDRALQEYFDQTQDERVFVKSIERVQGDERDAIILSVGYGRQADGSMNYNFGPLNQQGGERRLNVAVTRARHRLTVVSTLSAADLDPSRCTSRGVELLRSYLQFVESGGLDLAGAGEQTPLNAFELDVKSRLEREGVNLHCQVGVGRYRIDFAVLHPEVEGRYVLAIEADGAAYHSSPTARDRDRLRQQVLEDKGWVFHRIWSTDWFTDPQKEVHRTLEAIQQAVDRARQETRREPTIRPSPAVLSPVSPSRQRGPRPKLPLPGTPIDQYSRRQMDQLVEWIQSDEVLRTDEQLREELKEQLGFKRMGSKIRSAIDAALERAK